MVKYNNTSRRKINQRFWSILVLFSLLFSFSILGMQALAEDLGSGSQRVFDYAEILDYDDIEYLEILIAEFIEETNLDFVLLTSDEAEYSADDATAIKIGMAVADDFYDYNGFGIGEDYDGMIYFIDMSNRIPIITTSGVAIDYITDSRLDSIFYEVDNELRDQDFTMSAYAVLRKTAQYVAEGIPDDQYRYDEDTGEITQPPAKPKNKLTLFEAGASGFIGLIFSMGFYTNVSAKYGLTGSTYTYNVRGNSAVEVKEAKDEYIRTSVVRTAKPKSSSGSGSGGGSRTHTSSSGRTHGGGGGSRF